MTSAVYSSRLKQNIALAMVSADSATVGTELSVNTNTGQAPATIVPRPFYDPQKKLATG